MTDETHDLEEANPPQEAEPLSHRLGLLGKIDDAVYRVEVTAVVTALVLMSVMVFTDVVYQLTVGIGQYLDKSDPRAFSIGGVVLGFIALIAYAATGDNRTIEARGDDTSQALGLGVRIGITVGVVVACVALAWALLNIESSTVYRAIAITGAIPVGRAIWLGGNRKLLGVFAAAIVFALVLFGRLPTGYSWSQSYSLILLLWVSFLGASVAARQRRHLRVDLARKLMSPKRLPLFNAVSYSVAALFTASVFYLGFIYMFGHDSTYLRPIWDAPTWLPEGTRTMLMEEFPLPQDASVFRRALQVLFSPSEPGELPDWLKVAAIPVSMFLICVRFMGHAVVFAQMARRSEEFVEGMGAH